MLGRLIGQGQWSWAAFGKHPAARDYFQMNMSSPLAGAFGEWVQNGFGLLSEEARRNRVCAWRFWSRGTKKGGLICGLCKSSGDGIGRPYPLVLLGEGQLDRWEQHWHLLPFVLSTAWEQLEYTASRRLMDVAELETDLYRLETPTPSWKQTLAAADRESEDQDAQSIKKLIMDNIQDKSEALLLQQKLTIPLDQGQGTTPLPMAAAWHQALMPHIKGAPVTVFMGGTPQHSFLVLFSRPLMADDFVDLWTQ